MMKYQYELTYSSENGERVSSSSDDFVTFELSDDGERHSVRVRARKDLTLLGYSEWGHDFFTVCEPENPDPKGDLYFINGYQSWTDTREYYGDARERDVSSLPTPLIRSFALDRYGDATFYQYDKRILHGYDVFYVRGKSGAFISSLNTENAYLIIEVTRRTGSVRLIGDVRGAKLNAGDEFTVCDYLYAGSREAGLALFDKYYPKRETKKIFGYTSWYNYYQKIDEKILLRDLDALDSRFDLFQVDDGYETFVGDWLDVDAVKFPSGLEPIVRAVHEKGLKAGIWLAPFVAEEQSRLFREKPEWIRKRPDGTPFKSGSNWSGHYALDLENPEVTDYISHCLKHYADLGFDFFKLDFLYAANLPDYEGETRSRSAERAYSFLRKVLGDHMILGCGATLGNAAGKFDYLRIGPDVSLKYDDAWYMKYMHRERISTKVTIQNTIFRSFMDRRFFGNDPDVFLLRDDNISLSPEQRKALITINALFGSVMMTSDNLAEYDEEKRNLLAASLDLFQNAAVTGYERNDRIITVRYEHRGEAHQIRYDTEKGVLVP